MSLSVYRILESLTSGEGGVLCCCDGDGFAGLGVAAGSLASLLNLEGSKANKLNLIASLESCGDSIEGSVYGCLCILLLKIINLAVADKLNSAMAIVTGVQSYDDMLNKCVVAVSARAAELGVTPGMTGREALLIMK